MFVIQGVSREADHSIFCEIIRYTEKRNWNEIYIIRGISYGGYEFDDFRRQYTDLFLLNDSCKTFFLWGFVSYEERLPTNYFRLSFRE